LAASKFELQDEFVTMDKLGNRPTKIFHAHVQVIRCSPRAPSPTSPLQGT
jgi:hypothetical protein